MIMAKVPCHFASKVVVPSPRTISLLCGEVGENMIMSEIKFGRPVMRAVAPLSTIILLLGEQELVLI